MIILMNSTVRSTDDIRVQDVIEKAISFDVKGEATMKEGGHTDIVQVFLIDDDNKRVAGIPDHPFRQMNGVREVVRVSTPEISLKNNGHSEPRHIKIGSDFIGRRLPCVPVFGHCAADQHIDKTAKILAGLGIKHLRGGGYKPRSNAFGFRGHGEKGWEWLVDAAHGNGMESVWTEVIESKDIETVLRIRDSSKFQGDIVLWVGARNTGNQHLLEALGTRSDIIAMVKHSPEMKSIDQFIERASFVVNGPMFWKKDGSLDEEASKATGNDNLMLCVRGLTNPTEHSTRRFYGNVGWIKALHEEVWAPVVYDPSHIAGNNLLVPETLREGMVYHPEAVLIETHCAPSLGLCDDSYQSVNVNQIPELLEIIQSHNEKLPKNTETA